MISGIIKLKSHLDITVEYCSYFGKGARQKIIDRWMKQYPGLFHCGATIQILPKLNLRIHQPPPPKEKHPDTIYDNLDTRGFGIAKHLHNSTNGHDTP